MLNMQNLQDGFSRGHLADARVFLVRDGWRASCVSRFCLGFQRFVINVSS